MRQTWWIPALLVVVLLVPFTARAADQCGDADGNGAVTVTDGVQVLRAAAGLESSCTLVRCDLDANGSVSVTDGVNVLRAAAGLAVNLGCPAPASGCSTATVTVALAVPQPIGAASMTLAYPADAVTLPGSGDEAAARVTVLTTASLLNGGSPNDRDDRVEFGLVALDGVDSGDLLSVRFDCVGAAPTGADFACTLDSVFAPDGTTPVAGATCAVRVATE